MPCCWRAWPSARRPPAKLTAIVTADATDAQRLIDEMAFFAPELRCALFPDWETLPYDSFSPHQDLISERLATLWRISQGEADVVLVPATTALYRAGAARLPGRLHLPLPGQAEARGGQAQGPAHAGRLQPRHPGGQPRRIRGARRPDRPVPDGLARCPIGSTCSTTRSTRSAPSTPTRQRSLYPVPEVRLLPGREFPMDDEARARFRSRWRELLEGDPTKSRIYKDMGNGVATAGIEYYLPLFFDDTATVFDYLGDAGHGGAARRPGTRVPAFLAGHARSLPAGARRSRAAGAAAGNAVPHGRAVLSARQSACAAGAARPSSERARRAMDRARPNATKRPYAEFDTLPPWPSCAAPKSRWPSFKEHLRTHARTACWCWPRATAGARACSTSCAPASCRPPAFDSLAGVPGQRREAGHRHRRAGHRLRLARGRHRLRHRNRAVRHRARPRAGARSRSRSATSRR